MILNLRKKKNTDNNDLNVAQTTSTVTNQLDQFIEIDSALEILPQTSRDCIIRDEINRLDNLEKSAISEDVFDYWEDQLIKRPEIKDLYEVAITVLAAPASQSSIENGFSALALILRKDRTNTSPENLDNIMVINLNKKFLNDVVFDY